MSTTFDERERAFENKFAHDLELRFIARARAHFQAGLWAAGLLGKKGDEALAYAEQVRLADIHGRGPRAVARKIEADVAGRASGKEIDRKIAELRVQAEREIKGPEV